MKLQPTLLYCTTSLLSGICRHSDNDKWQANMQDSLLDRTVGWKEQFPEHLECLSLVVYSYPHRSPLILVASRSPISIWRERKNCMECFWKRFSKIQTHYVLSCMQLRTTRLPRWKGEISPGFPRQSWFFCVVQIFGLTFCARKRISGFWAKSENFSAVARTWDQDF